MEDAIREIINKIPKGKIFDSHFVIEQLIKNYSDEYLTFAASIGGENKSTTTVHGQIGKQIAQLCGENMIERVGNEKDEISFSTNIHGKPSKCKAWRRR